MGIESENLIRRPSQIKKKMVNIVARLDELEAVTAPHAPAFDRVGSKPGNYADPVTRYAEKKGELLEELDNLNAAYFDSLMKLFEIAEKIDSELGYIIIAMYGAGKSAAAIGEELGCSQSNVFRLRRSAVNQLERLAMGMTDNDNDQKQ